MSLEKREGEVALPFNPAERADASVTFIGQMRTPWAKGRAPRNIRQAREAGGAFCIELNPAYWPALKGLSIGNSVVLLYWMHQSRRDLIVQAPRHADGPRGTFALRSPARPNPIALATVKITAIDPRHHRISIDAIDCYDGTPLLDIKPWLPSIDAPTSL